MRWWSRLGPYQGVVAAVLSALFLGSTAIIAKIAYSYQVSPLGLAAWRTLLAAVLLWLVYGVFARQYCYIFPVGLAECALAGAVNGVGSIFYYVGLTMISASLGTLLYTTYPFFVALLLRLDGHRLSRLTVLRLTLTLIAIYLLTTNGQNPIAFLGDAGLHAEKLTGVALLLLSAVFYAFHVVFSQRALYDVPPPTVTLYSLTAMAATVIVAWVAAAAFSAHDLVGTALWAVPPPGGLWAIAGLALVTALSRLSLFIGVKRLGGVQTTLLSVGELMVTLILSLLLLNEQLHPVQWAGAALLVTTQLLMTREQLVAPMRRPRIDIAPPIESVADQ